MLKHNRFNPKKKVGGHFVYYFLTSFLLTAIEMKDREHSAPACLLLSAPKLAQADDDSGTDVGNSIFLPEELKISRTQPLRRKKREEIKKSSPLWFSLCCFKTPLFNL